MPLTLSSVLADSYKFLWQNRQDLFAYTFLPVVLVAGAKTLALWLTGQWQVVLTPTQLPADPEVAGEAGTAAAVQVLEVTPTGIGILLVTLATYVMFAVAWHRKYLIGNEGNTVGAALRWGTRQWRYLTSFLLLLGIALVASFLLSVPVRVMIAENPSVAPIAIMVVLMLVLLIYGRLLLVFPAAATDERFGLKDSIECTKGRTWLMAGIAVLPPLPMMFVLLIVSMLLANLFVPLFGASVSLLLVLSLIQQGITFIGIAAGVTALSIAHKELTGTRRAGGV
jgi:hypothetical protein